MNIKLESVSKILEKVGLKLVAKDGKVELASNKVELMAEAKTADGQMIATPADAWASGVEVFIVDAEGNPTPAPDGEYELEDGSKIVVAGGLVTEIMEKVKPEETEMSSEDIQAVIGELGNRLNDLQEQVNSLTTERDNANAELAKVKEANTSLSKQVSQLSKAPATKSAKEIALEMSKQIEKKLDKPLSQMTYTERVAANLNK
jgi:hypothetical protein